MEVLIGSTFKDRGTVYLSGRVRLRRCDRTPEESWSSVGECSEKEDEEEDDDAVSSSQGRWSDSFSSSLEDSLPIKRGLSTHYKGRSKSFGNLMEVKEDLEKVESPLNKRRRLIIANKLRRRSLSSFNIYSNISPNSMPLLALQESDHPEDYKYNDTDEDDETSKLKEKRIKMTNNTRDYIYGSSD